MNLDRYVKRVTIGEAELYLAESVGLLNSGQLQFDSLVTDPPYSSGGLHKSSRARSPLVKYLDSGSIHPDFSGDQRDQRSWVFWMQSWLTMCHLTMPDGAFAAVFTDCRQLPSTTDAYQAAGFSWRGIGVWDKKSSRPIKGGLRPQAEYIVWGTRGANHGTAYGAGVFSIAMPAVDKLHATAKPVPLLEQLVQFCGQVVCDPFMGSGSTAVAALQSSRKFVGVETSPEYFEIACQRIEALHRDLDSRRSV